MTENIFKKKTDAELKMITDKIVQQLLDYNNLSVAEIILYGSYARGDANEESDIDIMILCNDDKDRVQEYEKDIWHQVDHVGFDNDIMIQTVVQAKDFFDYWVDVLPFYKNVRNDGVILYG